MRKRNVFCSYRQFQIRSYIDSMPGVLVNFETAVALSWIANFLGHTFKHMPLQSEKNFLGKIYRRSHQGVWKIYKPLKSILVWKLGARIKWFWWDVYSSPIPIFTLWKQKTTKLVIYNYSEQMIACNYEEKLEGTNYCRIASKYGTTIMDKNSHTYRKNSHFLKYILLGRGSWQGKISRPSFLVNILPPESQPVFPRHDMPQITTMW